MLHILLIILSFFVLIGAVMGLFWLVMHLFHRRDDKVPHTKR